MRLLVGRVSRSDVERVGALGGAADDRVGPVGELVEVEVGGDELVADLKLRLACGRTRREVDHLVGPLRTLGRQRRPLTRLDAVHEDLRALVADPQIHPADQFHTGIGRVDLERELAAPDERTTVVGERLQVEADDLWQLQPECAELTGAVSVGQRQLLAGGKVHGLARRFGARLGRLGVLRPERLHHGDDVLGLVGRVEGLDPARVRELAVVDVVEERVALDGHPHRLLVRHRDADVDATTGLERVGDQRVDEGRAQLAVDNILQTRVDHLLAVHLDGDGAGLAHIALVAGEPDRGDLARTGVLGDHAAGRRGAQAGVLAVEAVVVGAVAAETGELLGADTGRKLRQPVELTVDVPSDRAVAARSTGCCECC